ncbi:hypothetical protein [Micromonospora sp. WMMD812]|uniref:hypothetical protein n=1 Tax=Micromonospora sp. WMMD812 TaxID=3015152 RepID=UPI00248BB47B|nr:hypothetical protein [Micromonospora sp. WMMD812]WBB68541.1 hypothetical protein O7603_03925 [Micromonospora sp. WMMD812]
MTEKVEVRVHGVAGARAETILDHPIVVRVAGDRRAGFYRIRPGLAGREGVPGVTVEAYRWGDLTGGALLLKVLTLLLLPFMLSNVSVWMRPAGPGRHGVLTAMCRLLAGTLTAAYALAVVGVTIDLIGYQCAARPWCAADRPLLSWLGSLPHGVRIVLLAVVPFLAIRLIWWIGSRRARNVGDIGPPAEDGRAVDGLADPMFWDDDHLAGRLRWIHFAIATAIIDAGLIAATMAPTPDVAARWLLGGCGLLLLSCTALLSWGRLHHPAARRPVRALRLASIALTVLALAYALVPRTAPPSDGNMPGTDGATAALAATQGLLLLGLAALTVRHRRRTRTETPPILLGMGTPVLAAAAVIVAAAYSATFVYRTADLLDRGAIPNPVRAPLPGAPPLEPPAADWWAATAAIVGLLIAAAALASSLLLTRRRRRRNAERIVRRDFPHVPPEARSRLVTVELAVARSQATELFGPTLVALLLISSVGLGTIVLDLVGTGPTQLASRLSADKSQAARVAAYLTDAGIYLISAVVIGLVVLSVTVYRSPDARRTLSALWDLGTFWPRTIHPFAPPSYGKRAVPELVRRVSALTRRTGVVISGHSHGSVLAAAAVLRLPPDTLRRVALLTHGCPLQRLYARVCPAYLGEHTLRDLGGRLDWRWRNLWRDTDSVGGPVFPTAHRAEAAAGAVDIRVRDPQNLVPDPDDTVPPPIEGHRPYHDQRAFRDALRELAEQVG